MGGVLAVSRAVLGLIRGACGHHGDVPHHSNVTCC